MLDINIKKCQNISFSKKSNGIFEIFIFSFLKFSGLIGQNEKNYKIKVIKESKKNSKIFRSFSTKIRRLRDII